MATAANVPVVVMSGYFDVCDEVESLQFAYVQKPFPLSQMTELVKQLLSRDLPIQSGRGTSRRRAGLPH